MSVSRLVRRAVLVVDADAVGVADAVAALSARTGAARPALFAKDAPSPVSRSGAVVRTDGVRVSS